MADIVVLPAIEVIAIESPKIDGVIVSPDSTSITTREIYNVVIEVPSITTIIAGQAGPAGPTGLSEDSVAYARQIDFFFFYRRCYL